MANDITTNQDSWHRRQSKPRSNKPGNCWASPWWASATPLISSSFGLTLRRGRKTLNVWVDCDPEGNGPGHLNIEEES